MDKIKILKEEVFAFRDRVGEQVFQRRHMSTREGIQEIRKRVYEFERRLNDICSYDDETKGSIQRSFDIIERAVTGCMGKFGIPTLDA